MYMPSQVTQICNTSISMACAGGPVGRLQHDRGRAAPPRQRAARHLEPTVRPPLGVVHPPLQLHHHLLLPCRVRQVLRRGLRPARARGPGPVQPADAAHDPDRAVAERVAVVRDGPGPGH